MNGWWRARPAFGTRGNVVRAVAARLPTLRRLGMRFFRTALTGSLLARALRLPRRATAGARRAASVPAARQGRGPRDGHATAAADSAPRLRREWQRFVQEQPACESR